MKVKILNDIFIVYILTIILVLSIIFIPSTVIRIILGLPFLLFFPGYTLLIALFVNKKDMNFIEKLAFSIILSVAIVGLIGFGLNYLPSGISMESALLSIAIFIFVSSAIAWFRRALLKSNHIIVEYSFSLPNWSGTKFSKTFSIILIIAIFCALGILIYVISLPKMGESFTEFYILGLEGKAQDYPVQYTMSDGQITQVTYNDGTLELTESGKVTLGIVNNEHKPMIYFVKMTIDDEPININIRGTTADKLGPVELQPSQKFEEVLEIIPKRMGDNQKVELLLYVGTENTPKHTLRLWINVDQAN